MPQQAATIESLPMAFEVVKAMQADSLEWSEGYRPPGRQNPGRRRRCLPPPTPQECLQGLDARRRGVT